MVGVIINPVAFAGSGSAGNQTITDPNGPGATPKAALFVMSGATALNTITAAGRISVGMTDGTNHRAVSCMAEDNAIAASSDCGVRVDNAGSVILMTNTGGHGLQAKAAFVSFGTDAVTVSWDVASSLRGYVVLFYGDNLQANVTSFACDAVLNQLESTTAPGFMPDLIIAASVNMNFAADSGQDHGMLSFGTAVRSPSLLQSCATIVAEDRRSNTSTGSIARSNRILSQLTSTAGVLAEGVTIGVDTFDTNGFTLKTLDVGLAMEGMYLSLKLDGQSCWAGAPTINADTTGVTSITDPAFRPAFVLMAGLRAGTVDTIENGNAGLSIGVANSLGQHTAGWVDRDNLGTSDAACNVSIDRVVGVLTSGAVLDWRGDFVSFDQTGWSIDITDTAAADRPTPCMAIKATPVFTETEQISESTATHVFEALSETVSISESVVLELVGGAVLLIDVTETESLSEAIALHVFEDLSETIAVSETIALLLEEAVSETVSISETTAFDVGVALSETVAISESPAFQVDEALTETVSISEAIAFSVDAALSETESIVESIAIHVSGDVSETETISESVTLVIGAPVMDIVATDTEQISEAVAIHVFEALTETVSISEDFVFLVGTDIRVLDETVSISETAFFVTSIAIFDVTDTEQIVESALLVLGPVLSVTENVSISDASNFGEGIDSQLKAMRAGAVFQW